MLIKVPVCFNLVLFISFEWSFKVLEKSLNLILTNGQEPCAEDCGDFQPNAQKIDIMAACESEKYDVRLMPLNALQLVNR